MDQEPVREYLFIDRERLSSYVDQLRAPVTYDKVPVWSAELALPGPVAKAQQSRVGRAFTVYEQLAYLEQQLAQQGQLGIGSWSGGNAIASENQTFRVESCLARRAVIARAEGHEPFGIWVSRYIQPLGTPHRTIVLFENLRMSDAPEANYRSLVSAFLAMMLESAIPLFAPGELIGSRFIHNDLDSLRRLTEDVATNPIEFFTGLGATLQPERAIRAFYRVRTAGIATVTSHPPVAVTIGYPISIVETGLEAVDGDSARYKNNRDSTKLTVAELEQHNKDVLKQMERVGAPPSAVARMRELLLGRSSDEPNRS
jgi:hypothetical protein